MSNNTADANWSFEIVTTPQEDELHLQPVTDVVPTKVKIRVKKRENTGVSQQSFISVPKLKHKYEYTKKFRAVHSDQTIMSFNMYTKSERTPSPPRKSQKNFFHLFKPGKCLGTQSEDEEDPPYMLTTAIPSSDVDRKKSSNTDVEIVNTNSEDILDVNTFMEDIRPPLYFFGKCKRGGCLDPPFGEDKYVYQPSIQPKQTILKDKEKLVSPVTQNKSKSQHSEITVKISISTAKNCCNEIDTQTLTTLMPYKIKSDISNKSLLEEKSKSIITYTPETSSADLNTNCSRKKSSVVKDTKLSTINDAYFTPHLNAKKLYTQKKEFVSDPPLMDVSAINDSRGRNQLLQVNNVNTRKVYTVSDTSKTATKPEENLVQLIEETGDATNLIKGNDRSGFIHSETEELNTLEVLNSSQQVNLSLNDSNTNMRGKDKLIRESDGDKHIFENDTLIKTESSPIKYEKPWLLRTVVENNANKYEPILETENENSKFVKETNDQEEVVPAPLSESLIQKSANINTIVDKHREDALEKSNGSHVLDNNDFVQPYLKSLSINEGKNKVKDMNKVNVSGIDFTNNDYTKTNMSDTNLDLDKDINSGIVNYTDENLTLISKDQPIDDRNIYESNKLQPENKSISSVNTSKIEKEDNRVPKISIIEKRESQLANSQLLNLTEAISINNLTEQQNIDKGFVNHTERSITMTSKDQLMYSENRYESNLLDQENISLSRMHNKPVTEKNKEVDSIKLMDKIKTVSKTIIIETGESQLASQLLDPKEDFNTNNLIEHHNKVIDNEHHTDGSLTLISKGLMESKNGYESNLLKQENTTVSTINAPGIEKEDKVDYITNGLLDHTIDNRKKDSILRHEEFKESAISLNYYNPNSSEPAENDNNSKTTPEKNIFNTAVNNFLTSETTYEIKNKRFFPKNESDSRQDNALSTYILFDSYKSSSMPKVNDSNENNEFIEINEFIQNLIQKEIIAKQWNFMSKHFSPDGIDISKTDVTSNRDVIDDNFILNHERSPNKKKTEDYKQNSVEKKTNNQTPIPPKVYGPLISKTLLNKNNKNSMIVDLGFQTYINEENIRVIRTFDVARTPERIKNDSISKITSKIKMNEKKEVLKINSKTQLFIEIKHTTDTPEITEKSNDNKERTGTEIKHCFGTENNKHLSAMDIKKLKKSLTALYEYDLVPVEKLIKSLIHDIDKISRHHVLLKKTYNAAGKIKLPKPTKSNNKCTCLRK